MNASLLIEKRFIKKIGIVAVIFVFVLIMYAGSGFLLFDDPRIFPNVFIHDINVGGLTSDEAKLKADERLKKRLDGFVIQLIYGDNIWNLNHKDIDLHYLLGDSIEKAYKVGRNKSYAYGFKTILSLRNRPEIIKLEPEYSSVKIENKINEISKIIDKPPVDAGMRRENENFIITKGVPGVEVDKKILEHSIVDAINNFDSASINISTVKIEPKITENSLENIKDLIGESVTGFNSQNKGRTENIKIAADAINGTILMPGEEFSFNDSTGPRSVEAGYKEATVIVDGEFTTGTGGGVCQVSTTLYQAVLKSDMEVTSRRNHGLPVGYVPMGQDATIAYGYIDFKFVNNKNFPVYIEMLVRGGEIYAKLYGKKADNIYVNLESEVLEVIEPKMQIKKDESMYLSEREIGKDGKKGYRVVTYKVYLREGREIKRELVSKDYYPPRDGIIIEGTRQEYSDIYSLNI